MTWRVFMTLLALAIATMAPARAEKLKVTASFSILGDLVQNVGGQYIDLTTLVGPDADAHVFQAAPQHARAVASAKVFFVNGRGFDDWAKRLLVSTGSHAKLVVVSAGLKKPSSDPHAWQDIANAIAYVRAIADALALADPAHAQDFAYNANGYAIKLHMLQSQIDTQMVLIPSRLRRVITTHDAFGYFGAAHEIKFIAPLGISTENQPSAKGVAALISQIKREKVKALFVENISDSRLITQIARETGVTLGGKLYSDALSAKSGPASTYISMMLHNAKLLTEAMSKGS